MIALAFDPGVTTGYAFCAISGGKITDLLSDELKVNELGLYQFLNSWSAEHVIYETFEFRNAVRGGTELYSRNLIGVINLHYQINERSLGRKVRLYEQTPAGAMGHWTNEKMKVAGLHRPGKDHANDAMRHLLYWLTFRKGSTLWHETSNHFLRRYVQAQ